MPTDRDLFQSALDLPSPTDRAAYLDEHCPDAGQRARVEKLLAAHADAGGFLEDAAATGTFGGSSDGDVTGTFGDQTRASSPTGTGPGEQAGAVIGGKYTLVEPVGEGGMGSVWRAKQTEPVKRFVAVKLIKAGMDSKQVLARFEAERQALALMDHPNIAKVLDGGLHENRPFFVMELVKGTPITDYCDAAKLMPHQRLELFVQACQAIQHAHQKGIIHRDIKPSNVLVALYDDRPVVKVIDFGVAKATGGTLTEKTLDTGFGGVVGTPQYMSPEQAMFNNLDIDTRSDVYALGVLLYELLAGSPPFSGAELKKKGLLEILRIVREEEPPRPSTKLSTADALPSISANRGTEPKKLTGLLRNELDWIVMKALEKDRTRRYESANGFAADIQRYLAGEAVLAHPPSTAYRVKKFVRRNKPQVIAASAVFVALVAGIVGTTLGLLEARRQAEIAEEKERDANRETEKALTAKAAETAAKEDAERAARAETVAKEDAEAKRKAAEANLAVARKAFGVIKSVFNELSPTANYATAAELRDALKANLPKALDQLDTAGISDPLVLAELQDTLGLTLLQLGEYELAVTVLTKSRAARLTAQGAEHSDTLNTTNTLALSYKYAGKLDRAIPLYEETLRLRQATAGRTDPRTLQVMINLGAAYQDDNRIEKAIEHLEAALAQVRAVNASGSVGAMARNNLAVCYSVKKEFEKALPLYREALEMSETERGARHPETIRATRNLAVLYKDLDQLEKAIPLFQRALVASRSHLGPDHPDTLRAMLDLAKASYQYKRYAQAIPLLEEAIPLAKRKLGLDHEETLYAISTLGFCYRETGRLDKALPLCEEAYQIAKAKHGPDHRGTINELGNLGECCSALNLMDRALPLLEEATRRAKAKLGATDPLYLTCLENWASAHLRVGRSEKALPMFEEVLKFREAHLGRNDPLTLKTLNDVVECYWPLRQPDRQLPFIRDLLARQEKVNGRMSEKTLMTVAKLGVCLLDGGRAEEAIPFLTEAYRASRRFPELRVVIGPLEGAYRLTGKAAEGAKLIGEQLADARLQLPKDSPQLAGVLAQAGMGLIGQKAYAEAEPLLREALTIREKAQPDAWTTFNTQSMLGGALLGQKKYADAEPLLLKGYEGLKAREKTIPPQGLVRIPEALDRLIVLYTALNKPDEVKKYRDLRAAYPPELAPPPKAVR